MNATEKYLNQLEEVLELSRVITSTFAWDDIIENIVKRAVELVEGANTGVLFLYDEQLKELVPQYGWGVAWEMFRKIRLKPKEFLGGKAFFEKRAMLFNQDQIATLVKSLRKRNHPYYKNVFPYKDQDFRSSMCVPLIWKKDCMGMLAVHNVYSSKLFNETDLHLVERIATHAAVALANSRMYLQQQVSMERLTRSIEVHEALTQMVLNEEGLERIAFKLAELLSRPIYILNTRLVYLAKGNFAGFSEEEGTSFNQLGLSDAEKIRKYRRPILLKNNIGEEFVGAAISSGESIFGYLIVPLHHEEQINFEIKKTIEQAAMVIALEMMKNKVIYETEKRIKGDLLQEVLQGDISKETYQRLSVFGYNPAKSYMFMVCSIDLNECNNQSEKEEAIEEFLKSRSGTVTFHRGEDLVILYPMESKNEKQGERFKEVYKVAKDLVHKLEVHFHLKKICVGIGSLVHHIEGLAMSYYEAEQTLTFLKKYGNGEKIWTYRSLGPLRFLLKVANEKTLQIYMEEVLGPLLKKGKEDKIKFLETLITWIQFDRQMKKTAQALFIHTNTLIYRLQKIEEILEVDLHNEDDWMTVQLAVRLWQTLNPSSED